MRETSDLSERVKIEREIEGLRWKVEALDKEELLTWSIPVIDSMAGFYEHKPTEGEPDWGKEGRA